jgi:hypothetical protein
VAVLCLVLCLSDSSLFAAVELDDLDDDPVLVFQFVPHLGGVNRVRVG